MIANLKFIFSGCTPHGLKARVTGGRFAVAAGVVACALLAGCAAPRVGEPVTKRFGGGDADAQMDFWHTLEDRPITSNDDAFHGLLLYIDGADDSADYAARVAKLKSRGLLPGSFIRPGDEAVERGTLAFAVLKALHVSGGWVLHVVGPSPHYALRELEYRGVFPYSSEQQPLTGAEFVGIMGKVEDYQRGDSSNAPAVKLPSESTGGGI